MEFKDLGTLFTKLDLSKNETDIFIKYYEYGLQQPSVIARKIGMNRVTVYHACERLHKKGFLNKVPGSHAVKYSPKSLVEIKEVFLDEKIDKDKEINEKLQVVDQISQQISSLASKDYKKPYTKVFQGENALKEIYKLSLEGDEILAYFNPWKANSPHAEVDEWHTKERKKLKIALKLIVPSITDQSIIDLKVSESLTQVKVIEEENFDFEDFTIITNTRLLIYSSSDSLGVAIESKRIANNQRALFKLIWKSL